MTNPRNVEPRIPVVCVDPSSIVGAELFDVNSWSGQSKGVIQSCWTEYSVLYHCVGQLSSMCANSDAVCAKTVETLQEQWKLAKFNLDKVDCFGQQPDLHIRIEAFFSGIKSLMDLIVQMLSTEQVVAAAIDGFHRDQTGYGGRVLNALRNNGVKAHKEAAAKLDALIAYHKKAWIDQVIKARDDLIHPTKGMHQVMFRLELAQKNGELILVKAHPPEIDSIPIDSFAQKTLAQLTVFVQEFLGTLHGKAVSNT